MENQKTIDITHDFNNDRYVILNDVKKEVTRVLEGQRKPPKAARFNNFFISILILGCVMFILSIILFVTIDGEMLDVAGWVLLSGIILLFIGVVFWAWAYAETKKYLSSLFLKQEVVANNIIKNYTGFHETQVELGDVISDGALVRSTKSMPNGYTIKNSKKIISGDISNKQFNLFYFGWTNIRQIDGYNNSASIDYWRNALVLPEVNESLKELTFSFEQGSGNNNFDNKDFSKMFKFTSNDIQRVNTVLNASVQEKLVNACNSKKMEDVTIMLWEGKIYIVLDAALYFENFYTSIQYKAKYKDFNYLIDDVSELLTDDIITQLELLSIAKLLVESSSLFI